MKCCCFAPFLPRCKDLSDLWWILQLFCSRPSNTFPGSIFSYHTVLTDAQIRMIVHCLRMYSRVMWNRGRNWSPQCLWRWPEAMHIGWNHWNIGLSTVQIFLNIDQFVIGDKIGRKEKSAKKKNKPVEHESANNKNKISLFFN